MPHDWGWDSEDDGSAAQHVASPPPPPREPPTNIARDAGRIRRRRLGAVAACLLVLAAILASVQGSSAKHTAPPRVAAGSTSAHAPVPAPSFDPHAAVASVLAYTPFVRAGGDRGHEVALTFDDGPGPYTPQLLSVLERYHVRATFFAIGRMERYFSASTARELRDGDAVGDHTENHPMLAQLSGANQREELLEPIIRIEALDGPRPDLFRPPYGSFDATTMKELRRLHLLMVLWSADTGDYQLPGAAAITERALAAARPGAIILLHDGGGNRSETIEALPQIIRGLRARGLDPVTVPQLLHDDPPPAGEPLPRSLAGD